MTGNLLFTVNLVAWGSKYLRTATLGFNGQKIDGFGETGISLASHVLRLGSATAAVHWQVKPNQGSSKSLENQKTNAPPPRLLWQGTKRTARRDGTCGRAARAPLRVKHGQSPFGRTPVKPNQGSSRLIKAGDLKCWKSRGQFSEIRAELNEHQ